MTTAPKGAQKFAPPEYGEASDEELRLAIPGDRLIEAANAITSRSMARRLPQLIRRAPALGWQVDRNAVIALLVVQVLSGVLEAFGLMATTGAIKPLIASQHIRCGAIASSGEKAGLFGKLCQRPVHPFSSECELVGDVRELSSPAQEALRMRAVAALV